MIFPNRYHKLAPICRQMTFAFFTNTMMLKNIENVLNKEFLLPVVDKPLSIHIGGDKTWSILISKARSVREINISFADHSIRQHERVDYLGYLLDSKLGGEAKTSKFFKKMNAKLKFLYLYQTKTIAYKRSFIIQCVNPATFRL